MPASLAFADRADWERRTGATWCAEACGWEAHAGIGAFGDDFDQPLCRLPAQIRHEGGTCTPMAAPTTDGGADSSGGDGPAGDGGAEAGLAADGAAAGEDEGCSCSTTGGTSSAALLLLALALAGALARRRAR